MPKNDAPRVGDDGKPLPHSMDGRFWAEEYCRMEGGDGVFDFAASQRDVIMSVFHGQAIIFSLEVMHAWFANAIVAGYDAAHHQAQPLQDRMLSTLRMAYLKHHLDDASIGWDELDDLLHTTLCEAMGDREFQRWFAEQVRQG